MGEHLQIVTSLHRATARDYLARMTDDKVEAMTRAREYGPDYWDGARRYGYGGYTYLPGRWQPVAEALIDRYSLDENSRVLDVGCGKGYLLYEIQLLLPGAELCGLDISEYALNNAHPDLHAQLISADAAAELPYPDESFDLVLSLTTLHNLRLFDVHHALREIERVGRRAYVVVESYRNDRELFNLECWALTARMFLDPDEWLWLFDRAGYSGDYEFIYFE